MPSPSTKSSIPVLTAISSSCHSIRKTKHHYISSGRNTRYYLVLQNVSSITSRHSQSLLHHKIDKFYAMAYNGLFLQYGITSFRELLRLIEVGASCFNHYCTGCDFSQRSVLHNVHRRICLGYSIPTFCLCC